MESFLRNISIDHTLESSRNEKEGAEKWLNSNQNLEGTWGSGMWNFILLYNSMPHLSRQYHVSKVSVLGLLVLSVKELWWVSCYFKCSHWFRLQFCILQKLWSRLNLCLQKGFWVIFSGYQSILKCKEEKIHGRYMTNSDKPVFLKPQSVCLITAKLQGPQ